MKHLLRNGTIALALLATPLAHAWTYNQGDTLLIFREDGFNNVEFDLGSVTQFTGVAAGSTITVKGWDSSLVTGVFGPDLSNVKVVVAASTGAAAASWLSSSALGGTVYDLTPSQHSGLFNTINPIGTKPTVYDTPSETNAYSLSAADIGAYDTIIGAGLNPSAAPTLGGEVAFIVETTIAATPTSFGFWQILPSPTIPKPAASYIGTFTITAAGGLTFTGGPLAVVPPAPAILGVTRNNGVSAVSFTTTTGGNYWLTFTNALGGSTTNWPVVSGPVAGDGGNHQFTYTNTTDAAGFYRIKRTP